MHVTESQLAGVLERFYVTVESGGGDGRGNLLTARGPVADADETAEALFAALSRMAALRVPPGTVVDAHICCDHADDRELSAMADIKRLMEAAPADGHAVIRALYPLDGPAMLRVVRWLLARFPDAPGDLPF